MTYMKVSEAAEKWGISSRRVRILCTEGKIPGMVRKGNLYLIPENAAKPADGRRKASTIMEEIAQKRERTSLLRPLTSGERERLTEDFAVEFVYHSNAIGGSSLTLKETALVLEGIAVDHKPLRDQLMAIGHRDAFAYVRDLAEKELPLSEKMIRQIHSLLLIDNARDKGEFRRIPLRVLGSSDEAVPPSEIAEKLAELLQKDEQRQQTMPPLERMALFHLEFEGIHPFVDGNGRIGRLLLNFDLLRHGFPPVNIHYTNRKQYYDAFDAFFRDGDVTAMTELIAGCVNERLEEQLLILKESE